MKLAIISPVAHLEQFSTRGDFDFALCHVLDEERELKTTTYRDYFLRQSQQGRMVMLDNGAHENSCVDNQSLLFNAKSIQATHVIAPDVVGDTKKTLANTKEFIDFLDSQKSTDLGNFQLVGVAQGTSFEEWLDCYKTHLKNSTIDMIAIPYDVSFFFTPGDYKIQFASLFSESVPVTKKLTLSVAQAHTRMSLMQYLADHDLLKKPIHLLGWSLPYEIMFYSKVGLNKIIDLSNDSQGYCVYPTVLHEEALQLNVLEAMIVEKISTPGNFWRQIESGNFPSIFRFIELIKRVVDEYQQ